MSLNQINIESPSGRRNIAVNPPASDSSQAACTFDLEVQNPCLETNRITNETSTTRTNISYPDAFSMKTKSFIGTWNVRSLTDPGKLEQVAKELNRLKLQLIGLSECRWKGSGEVKLADGLKFLFSGRNTDDHHRDGVGFLLSKRAVQSLLDWKPINERFIWCRFHSRVRNITIIQTYAPTEQADDETKKLYYEQLTSIVNNVQKGDIVIVMGDLNAKIGSDNHCLENVIGKHGLGDRNRNGELLINFCNETNLVIGGSLFPHKRCHKATWISPDGVTENQIDHFCIRRLWKKSLLDVRVKRSADVGSDHNLLVASLRLKIAAVKRPKQSEEARTKYNLKKLRSTETKISFVNELAAALLEQPPTQTVESIWSHVKSLFIDTSQKILGPQPRRMKAWMSVETWNIIEKRREAKQRRDVAKTRNEKLQASQTYNDLKRIAQRSCRRDKSSWYENLAERADAAAENKDMKLLYDITREIAERKHHQSRPLKDKQGNIVTSIDDQLELFKDHFSSILNNPDLPPPVPSATTSDQISRRNTTLASLPPQRDEIIKAIVAMKNNKSPGADNISAEMLRACPKTTADLLYPLFIKIWETEELPEEWLEGILVAIPKKGDLSQCKNYRGIMLLSIPSKVLTKVLLNRINEKLDSTIRRQQAGFRPNRSCVDHINTLRIIIEQSVEWKSALKLVFIDYSTAFDSINRDCIWEALRQRGIAPKLINLIKAQYDGFRCRVLYNNKLSAQFSTISGVRQGCLISPLLFLIVLDDVLTRAIDCKENRGIRWNFRHHLEDLAYADDICLMSSRHNDMQSKIDDIISESNAVGLKINSRKTKALQVNSVNPDMNFKAGDDLIENVSHFSYLGSEISADGGAAKDIQSRISKAQGAFSQLWKIWRSSSISTKTKLRLFNSNVKSVLLYGSETWLMTDILVKKLQTFVNKCLRKILKIWWPNTISNEALWNRCNQTPIHLEIKKRRWSWIGHTLRKQSDEICRQALQWNPQGSRAPGRPKHTWKRTIERDIKQLGYSFNEVKNIAKDRNKWRNFVEALCSTGSQRT